MTFNEWWAGQNLPENTKAVALAAWYASQLYGERIVQPVTAPGFHSHIGIEQAQGYQLDIIGQQLGSVRQYDESDRDYRERIQEKRRQMTTKAHDEMITKPQHNECRLGGDHLWVSVEMLGGHSEVRCFKCGVTP